MTVSLMELGSNVDVDTPHRHAAGLHWLRGLQTTLAASAPVRITHCDRRCGIAQDGIICTADPPPAACSQAQSLATQPTAGKPCHKVGCLLCVCVRVSECAAEVPSLDVMSRNADCEGSQAPAG